MLIKKKLKVGSVFEDGGRQFIVKAVNKDGTYSSEPYTETKPPDKPIVK